MSISLTQQFCNACSTALETNKGIDFSVPTKSFIVVEKAKENLARVYEALSANKVAITGELKVLPPSDKAYGMIKYVTGLVEEPEGEHVFAFIQNRAQIAAVPSQESLIRRIEATMAQLKDESFELVGDEVEGVHYDSGDIEELKGLVVELEAGRLDFQDKKGDKNLLLLKCVAQAAKSLYKS